MIDDILYILSVSLQLAGALCLIVYYWIDVKKRTLENYYSKSNIAYRANDNKVHLDRDKLVQSVKDVYINRIAFMYIAAGYLIGVFGDNRHINKAIVLIAIIVLGLIFMWFVYFISKKAASVKYKYDMDIDYDNLKEFVNVETNITNKEIDEIINENKDN